MIFPRFQNLDKIQEIRKLYDPLYEHVEPHITLVFPFRSSILTQDIKEHLRKSVRDLEPFKITLEGISKEDGNYLFLNITEGTGSIVELHKQLYTEILIGHYPDFLKSTQFKPHLTVGRLNDAIQLEEAYNKCKDLNEIFTEIATEIAVEIIEDNENSRIEMTIELG